MNGEELPYNNLYAAGECASTGLHGANRLASNSLLEAMVFAHRCFVDAAAKSIMTIDDSALIFPTGMHEGTTEPKEMILITQSLKELQQMMSDYVGIVRNNVRLQRAMKRIDFFVKKQKLYIKTLLYLRNCLNCEI